MAIHNYMLYNIHMKMKAMLILGMCQHARPKQEGVKLTWGKLNTTQFLTYSCFLFLFCYCSDESATSARNRVAQRKAIRRLPTQYIVVYLQFHS